MQENSKNSLEVIGVVRVKLTGGERTVVSCAVLPSLPYSGGWRKGEKRRCVLLLFYSSGNIFPWNHSESLICVFRSWGLSIGDLCWGRCRWRLAGDLARREGFIEGKPHVPWPPVCVFQAPWEYAVTYRADSSRFPSVGSSDMLQKQMKKWRVPPKEALEMREVKNPYLQEFPKILQRSPVTGRSNMCHLPH